MERSHEEVEGIRKLHEAATRGDVASLVELLDEYPLLLDRIIVDYCGSETPLHVAAMLGHLDFAREILARNKELALELDGKGRSPLHLASAKGNVEMVKLLLSKFQPSRICKLRDEMGRTALHVAAMKGRNEVLTELLSAHPESTLVLTQRGETILHLAVKHNHVDTLKLLLMNLNQGVGLSNSKDIDGNTIFQIAIANKQTEMVKYIVEGVDIDVCNNGCTPLDELLQSTRDQKDVEIEECIRAKTGGKGTGMQRETPMESAIKKSSSTKSDNHIHVDPKEWLNNMQSTLMVVASLIATVAYQAALTPAGGLWQEDHKDGLYYAGEAIIAKNYPAYYKVYYTANTMAFICANSIILLLISGSHMGRRWFMWLLMAIMWIAILSMALTYMIAALVVQRNKGGPKTPFEVDIGMITVILTIVFVLLLTTVVIVNMWFVRQRLERRTSTAVLVNV